MITGAARLRQAALPLNFAALFRRAAASWVVGTADSSSRPGDGSIWAQVAPKPKSNRQPRTHSRTAAAPSQCRCLHVWRWLRARTHAAELLLPALWLSDDHPADLRAWAIHPRAASTGSGPMSTRSASASSPSFDPFILLGRCAVLPSHSTKASPPAASLGHAVRRDRSDAPQWRHRPSSSLVSPAPMRFTSTESP